MFENHHTVLHKHCEPGNEAQVEQLLEKCANINENILYKAKKTSWYNSNKLESRYLV